MFVERFQGLILGICVRMLGHRQDAEDVAQEVFLRAFRNLHRWDQVRPLRPWLLTIAANRCRTHLDERGRRPVSCEASADILPERHARKTHDDAEEVQRALLTLRHEYRECFVLFYQQDLSVDEVARILERPEGTIKIWLHRARKEIAEYLQKRGFRPN